MPLLASNNLTFADWAKTRSPGDMYGKAAEVLSQQNGIYEDQVMVEGNLVTGDQQRIRTGLPNVYYKLMSEPVPSSKSSSAQITETCAILEGWSYVDLDIAELGDLSYLRTEEASTFLESLVQQDVRTMIYGSAANAKAYVGFANRYNQLTGAGNSRNVLSCGGTTNLTSMYLIGWSSKTVYGIYPKGSNAGIDHKYHGLKVINEQDTNGQLLSREAYADRWKLKKGLMVKDHRFVVRLCNIDVVALRARTGTQALNAATNILDRIAEAVDLIPTGTDVKLGLYGNRTVISALRRMARAGDDQTLNYEEGLNLFGKKIDQLKIQGVPIRIVDQIVNAEDQVT